MATPIIVNPNRPSEVVVNPTNQSQVSVRPTAPSNVIVNGSQKSGTPIIIDDAIDWARIEVMIENAVANSGGGNNDSLLELAEFVTYNELVAKRANSELIPAKWYAITDYVTKVNDPNGEFISAEHPFAVLVQAVLPNELSEFARAARYDDDYFENSFLTSWELKYCLDNDRFAWGDTENGKGVIYYMKDEWGNMCPYDFKNIMFKRYFERNIGTYVGVYDSENTSKHPALPNYDIDKNNYIYLYTFSTIFDGELYDSSLGVKLSALSNDVLPLCQSNKIGVNDEMNRMDGISAFYLGSLVQGLIPNSIIATLISTDDYPIDSEDPWEAAIAALAIIVLLTQTGNTISGSYNTAVLPPFATKISGDYNLVIGGTGENMQSCNSCAIVNIGSFGGNMGISNSISNSQDVYIEGSGNTIESFCSDIVIRGNYSTVEKSCASVRLEGNNNNVRVMQGTSGFFTTEYFNDCYIGTNSKGEIKVWNPVDLVTT